MAGTSSQVQTPITGLANPVHSLTAVTGSIGVKTVNVTPVLLLSGTTYKFEISATGHTLDYAELVLHLRQDRFYTGSVNVDPLSSVTITQFEENDLVDATSFQANVNSLQAASALNVSGAAGLQVCLKPMLFVERKITSALTQSFSDFRVPLADNSRLASTVRYAQAMFDLTSSNPSNQFLGYKLTNNAQSTSFINESKVVNAGQTFDSVHRATNIGLTSSANNASSSGSLDYRMNITFNGANTQIYKQYMYLWVD